MFLAKVIGSLVSTQKTASMNGQKLLLVEPMTGDPGAAGSLKPTGRRFVTVDTVGAGEGDYVVLTQGSSARLTDQTKNLPVDAVIIGIVDGVSVAGQMIYSKQG